MTRTSRRPASWAAVTYSSTTDRMSRGWKVWRSSSCSIGTRCSLSSIRTRQTQAGGLRLIVRCRDDRADAATHREIAGHRHVSRLAGVDEIVQDLVGDRLVEDAPIAKFDHVV